MAKINNRLDALERQMAELSQNQQETVKRVDGLAQELKDLIRSQIEESFRDLMLNHGKEIANLNSNHISASSIDESHVAGVNMMHNAVVNVASGSGLNVGKTGADTGLLAPSVYGGSVESHSMLNSSMLSFDFPRFNGKNPRQWLSKCQRYFRFYPMSDYEKILVAAMHMDEAADHWYFGNIEGKENVAWETFSKLLLSRFLNPEGRNLIGEFNKLEQKGTVDEYIAEFEELKAFMINHNRALTEDYFVQSFTSGLREDIGHMVELFDPSNLLMAMQLARKVERVIEALSKAHQGGGRSSVPGVTSARSKAPVTSLERLPPIKKLSLKEIDQRRKRNLCFNCDEPYHTDHNCRELFVIIGVDSTDEEESSVTTEDTTETEEEVRISGLDKSHPTPLSCWGKLGGNK